MMRRLRALVACGLLTTCAGAWPASPPWPESPYSYFAEGATLETVLREFAAGFSLGLVVEPGVQGTVHGRFNSASPTEFISRLGGVYGFAWYTQAGILYVSPAREAVMRTLPMPTGGAGRLRQTLTDLGVVEPRFGWGELPEHGVLLVSGPPRYVDRVETTLRQLPGHPRGALQISVFRLRHASADDRVIQFRDRQITQPGLASVLRGLMGAGGVSVGGGVTDEKVNSQPGAIVPLPALGASAAAPPGRPAPAGGGAGGPGRGTGTAAGVGPAPGASIQPDPRLNALVVTDAPERMPLYERLIAQLDVPAPLVEIEALIIDVNSERARELGINWSARGGSFSATFGVPQPVRQGMLSLTLGSDTGNSAADKGFMAQIRLLESAGDARIQSRPSVLTTDNIGALLDLSETFYIRVQGERVASVSPVTAGTTLRVTPRVVDGTQASIQLTVDIEDGQIQDRQVDSLPTIRRSSVSTQAVVRQDEALVIAGYSSDQTITSEQKVPVLSELPWVGALFSSKARLVQKRERIFVIRPRLVTDAPRAAPAP
ncbi:MAG: hypothetical protein RL522_676 [Pseudomonadota bacterium]